MLRPQAEAVDLDGKPDLKNPDLYLTDDFHDIFRALRVEEPVYWNPEADSTGFWAVTRYRNDFEEPENLFIRQRYGRTPDLQ